VPPLVHREKQAGGWGETHGGSHALFSPDWFHHHRAEASVGLAVGLPRLPTDPSGHPGRASPTTRTGSRRQARATVVLAGRAPTCPKQRFTVVTNGQQRLAAVGPDLHHRSLTGGPTMLPKLAVSRQPSASHCRAADPVPGRGGPERRRAAATRRDGVSGRRWYHLKPWTRSETATAAIV
jgi:hypothetical protein